MTGTAIILQGDARQLLLPDGSVDLVVTSPPYFGQRSYTDDGQPIPGQIGAERTPTEYLDSLIACTAEMARVLKPSGSIWLNLGDKYAGDGRGSRPQGKTGERATRSQAQTYEESGRFNTGLDYGCVPNKSLMLLPQRWAIRCVDELGLILRAEVVWDKTNGLPESVKDRVRRSHEHWFHLTKRPRYYCDIDAVRQAYDPGSTAAKAGNSHGQAQATMPGHNGRANGNTVWAPNPLGGLPPSVWRYPTQPLRLPEHLGVKHYATFPPRIVHRIVSGWCPAGGVVLDPFGGAGTAALVAKALDRVGISVDLGTDYCRAARWRTDDPKSLARAAKP